jgi:hypothetical protein
MINKEEWDAAYGVLIAEGRERLGAPPTFEEVEALSRGQLQEPDAERVRALLAHYPDLLRVLSEPFPETATGVLTDEQLAGDIAAIRARVQRPATSPAEFRRKRLTPRAYAIAAGIVIAIGIGSIAVRRMTHEPRAMATIVLFPDGLRGGSINPGVPAQAPVQLSTASDYTLKPAFSFRGGYDEYSLELLDLRSTPPRRVWLREHISRQPDDTYPVPLATDDLEPGLYRLVLYGSDQPLAEYTLRLSAPEL